MAEITNVVIGIQARSTSARFPRKWAALIDGKPLLQHVIDACNRSALYMNRHRDKTRMLVQTALLIPDGDEIGEAFRGKTTIVRGPEQDVLQRYSVMADKLDADYIVRITGDCPLIPPFLITKHIKTAVINGYDYLSNVNESSRTAADGMDCEVISRKLLQYAVENTVDPYDREHVTPFMRRRNLPIWVRTGQIVGFLELSGLKLSVDTEEDLERVRLAYSQVKGCLDAAEAEHGKANVHRL